jgi:hypothetical protein
MRASLARPARQALAAFATYLVLAVAATWPLARDAADHLHGVATPELNVWSLGVVLRNLAHDPLHLFDGNAFYPYAQTLAFSEHLFVPALLGAPVALATGNLVLTHNIVALLSLALAGLGMFLLARELTGDPLAGWAAGILYAFHTWNVNELIRLQILSNQWFPFLLLALLLYFERPGWGRAAAAGAAYAAQALSCMYWSLYAPLLALPALLVLQWRRRLGARQLLPLLAMLALALGLSGLFALPYVATSRAYGFARPLPEPLDLCRYLEVLPGHHLYSALLATAPGPNQNAAHFPGFLALALAVLGAWRGLHPGPLGRAFLLVLAACGFALSLGPAVVWYGQTLGPGPYALLFELVPGFRNVRYPERFSIFLFLALAVLLAAGLASLRPRLGRAGMLVLGALLFLEHFSAPLRLEPIPTGRQVPSVYRWLRDQADVRVVAEVPASRHLLEKQDARPMYFSTVHGKRTVQGFTGYFPPAYIFTRWRLFHFPEPESVAFLEKLGVDTVVVHPENGRAPDWVREAGTWERVAAFPEGDVVLRLRGAGTAPRFEPPSPAPAGLTLLDRRGWRVEAEGEDAAAAIDGDRGTAWGPPWRQRPGVSFEAHFPAPVRVARVSLAVAPIGFPTSLSLQGEQADGSWAPLPCDVPAAYDHLFWLLLNRPREASIDLDVPPTTVHGVRLRLTTRDEFRMPWSLPELNVYAAP